MKVVLVSSLWGERFGGAQVAAAELALGLRMRGHDVHVLGKDIDDLSLSFVAPLATQHDPTVAGVSTFRHGAIPR